MIEIRKFIDRRNELEKLESLYRRNLFTLVLITGRRRIGKSRLILEFMKNKNGIRIQFEKRKAAMNLNKMNRAIAKFFGIPVPNFKSFSDAFEFIVKQIGNTRLVIALDEFSYLIKETDVLAEFQTIVDEILKETNVFLILSGSAVSMLKRSFYEYTSPLYGRCHATLFLQPLKFKHLMEWFPKASIESLVKIYAVTGGVPRYLEFFSGKNVEREIINNFFDPSSFLFREAKEVFEEEFDEPETYYAITEAISHGYTRVSEIANYCFMEAKNVSKYLKVLGDLEIVQREFPIFSKKRKGGIYRIRDNYFNFWFRFVSKYFEDIETGFNDEAISDFEKNFNTYLGYIFEQIVKEFFIELSRRNELPIKIKKIGRWWHKNEEIDLIASDDETLILTEVKWKELTSSETERIIKDLKRKSKYFENKRIIYSLVAKCIEKKEEISKNYLLFDLNDFGKIGEV
ncbi:MAG: ATP-binding protein [Candidatus Odinarchaeota archaeon]|nr:ATP-binding protein [Candidatus Odinarchaeota archaeon]